MAYLQNFKHEIVGPEGAHRLVFLHGVMGSGVNWRKIVSILQDEYQILTYDQRGHGRSFKPESGYAPEDYALDLRMILDELGWSRISLIGHSMGGRNALNFAHKYPQRIEALVIEDIGPEGNPVAMQKTIDLIEMVPTPFKNKAAAREYLATEFVEKIKSNPQAKVLSQYFYTNIEPQADGSADWRFAKSAILTSLKQGHLKPRWEEVRDLRVPTLFIRGELSEDFTHAEFMKVLAANPKIQGVEIAGAGHWVHSERPKEFVAALQAFFATAF